MGRNKKLCYTQKWFSRYDLSRNNCRMFARKLARFLGLEDEFNEETSDFIWT
jgi:hypothetical protein